MALDLISRKTRNEFREACVGFVLREIDMIFDNAQLSPKANSISNLSGARRSRVEQYYANVDFASPADVAKIAAAFSEIVESLEPRVWQHGIVTGNAELRTRLIGFMARDGFSLEAGAFVSEKLRTSAVAVPNVVRLTEESVAEHVEKARAKIDAGDHAGAITNAYTLVEAFLKELLRRTHTEFKPDEGDIRVLYRLVSSVLNLNPGGENLEGHLKTILQGLLGQVSGLFEVANKAADRHARR